MTKARVPFTVSCDLDLGESIRPYLSDKGADIHIFKGDVPQSLSQDRIKLPYQIKDDNVLLEIPNGMRILVKSGKEIIYTYPETVSQKDVSLFILGSAWGALCYQRGLIPLHASAVTKGVNIHAFSGHSGAGKSTLSAALSHKGWDFFSDDIIIYDPQNDSDQAMCYRGQKDLKLWQDAIDKTQLEKTHKVRDIKGHNKFYAKPASSSNLTHAPLENLFILSALKGKSETDNIIKPLSGALAINAIVKSIYRPRYAEAIMGRKAIFEALARLSEGINIWEFKRLFLTDNFEQSVSMMDDFLKEKELSI